VNEVRALPPGTRVQVDVSALREVHPAGLAYLAYALARNREVALRGLNRRHERLLAYLLAEHVMRAATPAGATPEPSSSAAS
jgi:hypothetical protein